MKESDKVWAPNPDSDGEIRATFVAIAVDEPITVNGVDRDAAWISFEEGRAKESVEEFMRHFR